MSWCIRSRISLVIRLAASLATLLGGTWLLLADDSGPRCGSTPLDVKYRVVTTCFGGESGTLRLTHGPSTDAWVESQVEISDGNLSLSAVDPVPVNCARGANGAPMKLEFVDLTLVQGPSSESVESAGARGLANAAGENQMTCRVTTAQYGLDVPCGVPTAAPGACTLRLTPTM